MVYQTLQPAQHSRQGYDRCLQKVIQELPNFKNPEIHTDDCTEAMCNGQQYALVELLANCGLDPVRGSLVQLFHIEENNSYFPSVSKSTYRKMVSWW